MSFACPRCKNALVGRRIEDVVVHECPECAGVFLDENAIGLVVQDADNARARAIVEALPRHAFSPIPADGTFYVPCPTCGTMMNRKLFAARSRIVIDVCRSHGTFFDAGELPGLIDFVQSGALAREAARKTADRVPLDKQADSFSKQLALARRDRGDPTKALIAADAGAAFVEVLFSLLT